MTLLLSHAQAMIKEYESYEDSIGNVEGSFTVTVLENPRYKMKVILQLIDTHKKEDEE